MPHQSLIILKLKQKMPIQKTGSFMKENAQKAGKRNKKGCLQSRKGVGQKEAIKAGKAA